MADTGFSVPTATLGRFGPHYTTDAATGARVEYDPAAGEWSRPPAFPSGAGGLVSTVDDLLAFGTMLRAGGVYQGRRILSRPTIEAMTTNQLTGAQMAASGPDPGGALGWGFGVGVQVRRDGAWPSVGTCAWAGGLGSQWANDPVEGLVGVVLTNLAWTSGPPALFPDFWTCAYAAMDD
jgi:CubicO group peptidase (beta-lactamase class C family)